MPRKDVPKHHSRVARPRQPAMIATDFDPARPVDLVGAIVLADRKAAFPPVLMAVNMALLVLEQARSAMRPPPSSGRPLVVHWRADPAAPHAGSTPIVQPCHHCGGKGSTPNKPCAKRGSLRSGLALARLVP